MLVAVMFLDLVMMEDTPSTRTSRAAGSVVAILVAGVLMGELEMLLEVGVAGEGVDGAAWHAAGVAALAFTAVQLEFIHYACRIEKRGGHCHCLGFLAARINLSREIARLQLIVGFILGYDKVVIHVPGYPRVPVFFDIEERNLHASFSGFLEWQTRRSRVLLLVGAASPMRPVIIHPELPSLIPANSFVRLLIRVGSMTELSLTIRPDGLKHSFQAR
jgi:hypothetical protein